MDDRPKFWKYVILCLYIFFGLGLLVFAKDLAQTGDHTNSSKVVVTDTSADLLGSFKESDVDVIKQLIDDKSITFVGTAGHDIYLKSDSGKNYVYHDSTGELLLYLKLQQYEPVLLSERELKTSTVKGNWITLCFACAFVLFGLAFIIKLFVKRKVDSLSDGGNVIEASSVIKLDTKSKWVPKVRFSDVEGIEELMSDINRIVDCLKSPDKYKEIGARPPKGVILYGPPGTGKTLLSKAIAGEASVPFFSAVGSDFVEKYAGMGARRVRELYAKAKKSSPCIVFIDEIDAVAQRRGKDENGERDQTMNALLAELDGFDSDKNIITICATNRLDTLDEAFKRAGRFDLKLAVSLPDVNARERILIIHSKGKRLSDEISLKAIAKRCVGFSGAELEALLNEAAMSAVGKNHDYIQVDDIDDAFFKIVMLGNKKANDKTNGMLPLIAYHEAGHTLATKLLTNDSVSSVTIIGSSSGAGGATFRVPEQEGLVSKRYLKSLISVMYAGRAAEELYLKDSESITTGASNDIKQATTMIKDYLSVYGMGDCGMLDLQQLRNDYADIMDEAKAFSKSIYNDTLKLLRDHMDKLSALAESLLEHETLSEEEIDSILDAKNRS